MAYLIHPSALEGNYPALKQFTIGTTWRVAPQGTPIQPTDTLVVGYEQRFSYSRWLQGKSKKVIVLKPGNEKPDLHVPGVEVESWPGYLQLRGMKPFRMHTTMPWSWTGYTWFRIGDLAEMLRGRDGHLLRSNHCRAEDCAPFVRTGMARNRSYKVNAEGEIQFTLAQCVERMPWDLSVMGTFASFPYEKVPRAYLEWLVHDGMLGNGERMACAFNPKGATRSHEYNELRESVLYYLSMTTEYEMHLGTLREKGVSHYEGSACERNDLTREFRKQFERVFDERDSEWREFCTFGYWIKDTFYARGTSTPVRFEAHGPPTWLEIGEGRVPDAELPAHVKTGLTDFERSERWLPAEKENYDWRPVQVPNTYNKAVIRLFDLHGRLARWQQGYDHWVRSSERAMSERDWESTLWEREELGLELDRISGEYIGIVRTYQDRIPPEWGLRDALVEARKQYQQSPLLGQAKACELEETYEILETSKVEEWRKIRSQQVQATREYLNLVRSHRPAASWEQVQDLLWTKQASPALRHALAYAKTQEPNPLPRRKTLCFQ